MSLNRKRELTEIAKIICRRLRKIQTPAERKLWEALKNRNTGGIKFLRQHPIFHDIKGKETFFVADFYCSQSKVVIELDGPIHNYKLKQDKERDNILNRMGLTVIRISNEEIEKELDSILKLRKNICKNNTGE